MQKMIMPEALENSVEYMLHSTSPSDKLLIFQNEHSSENVFQEWMGHRAIGVVYHPNREWGNYVPTRLAKRYDAFLYIDHTQALHPIHMEPKGDLMPETYPFGV